MRKTFLDWDLRQNSSPSHGIPLALLKSSLGYTSSAQDSFLTTLLDSAFEIIKAKTNSPILSTQFIAKSFFTRQYGRLALPKLPLISVDGIKKTVDDVESALDTADYDVRIGEAGWVDLKDEFYDEIEITFTAGYATIPQPLITATNLLAGDIFRNRNSNLENKYVPMAVKTLIMPYVKSPYVVP